MIWAQRKFEYADFAPYQDLLSKRLFENAALYKQFIMVSTETEEPGLSTYYIGVPNKAFLVGFDGFEIVEEIDLPKEIDALLIADATTDEFEKRFRFSRP